MTDSVGPSLLVPTGQSGGGGNSIAGDQYWANVLLLLHCDGANGGTVFTDSSTYSRTVTNVGSATTSTTQAKFGVSSGAFNGTTQYLTVADSADWDMAGDFTIEGWIYPTSLVDSNTVVTLNGTHWQLYHQAGGHAGFFCTPNATIAGTDIVTLNAWHHLAAVRISGVVSVYLDGVFQASGPAAQSITPTGVEIGGYEGANELMEGYIDDVRITKGVGRYTGAFTPPTAAFPNNLPITYGTVPSSQPAVGAWTYINSARNDVTGATPFTLPATSLTTGNHIFVWVSCDNAYPVGSEMTDTAGNTYVAQMYDYCGGWFVYGKWFYCLNAIGNANNVVRLSTATTTVYGMLSMQFNKAGNPAALDMGCTTIGLTGAGVLSTTNDPITTNMAGLLLSGMASNSFETSVTWTGVTGITNPFSNDSKNKANAAYALTSGPLVGARATATGSTTQGKAAGMISFTDVVTTSFDPYFSNVVLLMHCDGTNGSTTFTDASAYNRTLTRTAGPTLDSAQKMFGSTSLLSSGNSGYVVTPASPDFCFSGDYTMEMWCYFTSNSASQFFSNLINPWNYGFFASNSLGSWTVCDGAYFGSNSISLNAWHYVATSRNGSYLTVVVDGILITRSPMTKTAGSGGVDAYYFMTPIPGYFGSTTSTAGTRLEEIRFTKGVGRYQGIFPVPTMPFASVVAPSTSPSVGVVLLTHFDGTNGQYSTVDSSVSAHAFTMVGGYLTSAQAKFGTTSLYAYALNYIKTPVTSSDWDLMGTALSCTIEFWIYPGSRGTGTTTVAYALTSLGYANWSVSISAAGIVSLNVASTISATITASASAAISLTTWTHVACVLNAGAMTVYVGGTGGTPVTLSSYYSYGATSLYLGSTGANAMPVMYLDEMRITKGTAVYTANFAPPVSAFSNPASGGPSPGTVFLMHATPAGYAFTDSSVYAQTIVNYIDRAYIQVATPSPPIGTYVIIVPFVPVSGLMYSIIAYLQVPYASGGYSTFWDVLAPGGSGTIECYYYPAPAVTSGYSGYAIGGAIFSWGGPAATNIYVDPGPADTYHLVWTYPGVVTLTVNTTSGYLSYSSTTTAPRDVWAHIALVNNAGVVTLYINGVGTLLNLSIPRVVVGTPAFNIGVANVAGTPIYGSSLFCEFRVSSTAVYTANFTPPTSALT